MKLMQFKAQAPIIAVILLLGIVTFVQGRWSERWTKHAELKNVADRVGRIPFRIGEWNGETGEEQDPRVLREAGAIDSITRIYHNLKKESLSLFILYGRPGQICYHTPENCYPAAGFVVVGSPMIEQIDTPTGIAEFTVNTYRKSDEKGGTTTLRVYWAYSSDGKWISPDNIKWVFGGQWGVFKMYVIVPVTDPGNMTAEQNRAHAFIRDLTPALQTTLFDGNEGAEPADGDADIAVPTSSANSVPAPVPAPMPGASAAGVTTNPTSESSPKQ